MPLQEGSSPAVIGGNIKELLQVGYKPAQAKAIAMSKAGKKKKIRKKKTK